MIGHVKILVEPFEAEDALSGRQRKVCLEVLDGPLEDEEIEVELPIDHPIFDSKHWE